MLTHRIMVMRDRVIVATFETSATSEDEVVLAATGGARAEAMVHP